MNYEGKITLEEAAQEVKLASRRIALLYLAFAKTAFKRLGDEEGRRFVIDAIKDYGQTVGKEVREAVIAQGLEPLPANYGAGSSRSLPRFGMHTGSEVVDIDGKERLRAYGCAMAEVWAEYGEGALGRLYCLVDPAKYMAFNPEFTLSHTKAKPDGDPYCEFCTRRTSEQERADFASDDADWSYIDHCEDDPNAE